MSKHSPSDSLGLKRLTVLTPTQCEAAGCERPAFGGRFCGVHSTAFDPDEARHCRARSETGERCVGEPIAHGICRAHYARWKRWLRRVEKKDSPRDVEAWLARDWARPIGAPSIEEQAGVSTRMALALYERIFASCAPGETVYDRCRQVLEEHARTLPAPSPAQRRAFKRVRRSKVRIVRPAAASRKSANRFAVKRARR